MGVFDGIEDKVLGDAADLDCIPVGREPFWPFTFQKQSALQRYWPDAFATKP